MCVEKSAGRTHVCRLIYIRALQTARPVLLTAITSNKTSNKQSSSSYTEKRLKREKEAHPKFGIPRTAVGLGADAGTWSHLAATPAPPHPLGRPPPAPAAQPGGRHPARCRVRVPPPPREVRGRGARGARGRRLSPTRRENKAAAALTFSVSVPRCLRRLLTEAGSASREKLRARQCLGPGQGASEAPLALQDPARRPPEPFPPSLPVPSCGRRAGGQGARGGGARPARGLPGAVVPKRAQAPVVCAWRCQSLSLHCQGATRALRPPRSGVSVSAGGVGRSRSGVAAEDANACFCQLHTVLDIRYCY
ncbi:atherin-like [Choloepus didactylus]|uniref:atherin-like n=1 Tax=Choloepus didactylus TaxID=27675 RepID=UPI0018A0C88D|nr:atherin-like [Choloepus didactylus]